MTRRQLAVRIERWRKLLAPEWRIKVMTTPPEDEDEDTFYAICQVPNPEYKEGLIYFADIALARDPDLIDITIVHELLHVIARDLIRTQLDDVHRYVPPNVHDDAVERAKRAEEGFVDRLSRVIVRQDGGRATLGPSTRVGSGDEYES